MVSAERLARQAASKVRTPPIPYVLGGRSDKGTDCINLAGWCVQEIGGRKEDVPRGSNTAWRESMQWTGTLAEAQRAGKLMPGALVYIRDAPTAQWPDGDYGHVGIYVGKQIGWNADQVIVHASSSRNGVYPSTIKNAWTHVAWLKCVDYVSALTESQKDDMPETETNYDFPSANSTPPAEQTSSTSLPRYIKITTSEGSGVRMRKGPGTNNQYMLTLAFGTVLPVYDLVSGWYQVKYLTNYQGKPTTYTGWIDGRYARPCDGGGNFAITQQNPVPIIQAPPALGTQEENYDSGGDDRRDKRDSKERLYCQSDDPSHDERKKILSILDKII